MFIINNFVLNSKEQFIHYFVPFAESTQTLSKFSPSLRELISVIMGSESSHFATATAIISPDDAHRALPWPNIDHKVPYLSLISYLRRVTCNQIKLLMFVESIEKLKVLCGSQVDEQINWIIATFICQSGVFDAADRFKYYTAISDTDFEDLSVGEKQHLFDPMMKSVLQTLDEAIEICIRKKSGKSRRSTSQNLSLSILLQNGLNPVV